MTPFRFGVLVAVLAAILDQAHKAFMLGPYAIAEKGRVALTPFLDLILVWNRGVSYGLFTQESEIGRWLLVGVGLIGAAVFFYWLTKLDRFLSAISVGLIIGGAIGNVIDRLRFGAVADFFLFHIGSFQWYVFNLADVWIVAGVIGMLLAWATERPENAKQT
ncbi:signal peptidase II [Afifella marina]|uniref:Lipoprotein signal peptidase n=1 Tax=Afifella marina DSM 2698 TaxID=1120955 RepID=A0A1G5M953_AFIMA|nr:signal peptidase II [Afifella marina]SCZ21695.1 signal peptidase II [Afifella marina DSM 2698]